MAVAAEAVDEDTWEVEDAAVAVGDVEAVVAEEEEMTPPRLKRVVALPNFLAPRLLLTR